MPSFKFATIRANIDEDGRIVSVSVFEREVFTGADGAQAEGDLRQFIDADPAFIAQLNARYAGEAKALERAEARKAARTGVVVVR